MKNLLFLVQLLLFFLTLCFCDELVPVTCGSVVKLKHKETNYNLHSHSIAWGSGSGQQSVTTTGTQTDSNSLWLVKEGQHSPQCETGVPVKCGDIIRLEHVTTGKNLHSHLFKSGLSPNQEVSSFGESGKGDTGDNWKIVCEYAKYWMRNTPVSFLHVDTQKYLYSSNQFNFNAGNCGLQCPIMGQTEVSATARKDVYTKWFTDQGIYFPVEIEKFHKEL